MPLIDRRDKSRYGAFTRRSLLVTGGMTAVFGVLAGRLYQLQIMHGDLYKTRAESNRVNERLIAPPRGRILDRFGIELATNRRNYRAFSCPNRYRAVLRPRSTRSPRSSRSPTRQRTRVLRDVATNKTFVPVPVIENLSWEDFARLNLDLPYLPGVQPDVGETRDYPYPEELSHVLGYVAAVSPEDEDGDDDDPLLEVPGFRIGKRGIEKEYDQKIRGLAGPAGSRSMPMAASFASFRANPARLARMCISRSTRKSRNSPMSGWAMKAPPAR